MRLGQLVGENRSRPSTAKLDGRRLPLQVPRHRSAGKTEGSWEPRWLLEEDGFIEYLELVDQYKATGGPMTFAEFALSRPDDFSQAMGASRDGRCAFRALDLAADALGISDWYSEAAVDALYCVLSQVPSGKVG
eukprot:jgi/Phyca11/16373/fgenesh1_pg.PHYCAscaffold_19_\